MQGGSVSGDLEVDLCNLLDLADILALHGSTVAFAFLRRCRYIHGTFRLPGTHIVTAEPGDLEYSRAGGERCGRAGVYTVVVHYTRRDNIFSLITQYNKVNMQSYMYVYTVV